MTYDRWQLKNGALAATLMCILNADCAKTEIAYRVHMKHHYHSRGKWLPGLEPLHTYESYAISDFAQSSTETDPLKLKEKLSNTPSIATNGFMVQAYQVPDSYKVHSQVALLQCSLWHPSRPTPGALNSQERLRAAVICGRTARGVVGTLTPGNGGQGRSHAQERFIRSYDHGRCICANWYHGRCL